MNATTATQDRDATLERIAAEHLDLDTLQDRRMDDLDFSDQAVWNLRAALQAAYEAGRAAAQEA